MRPLISFHPSQNIRQLRSSSTKKNSPVCLSVFPAHKVCVQCCIKFGMVDWQEFRSKCFHTGSISVKVTSPLHAPLMGQVERSNRLKLFTLCVQETKLSPLFHYKCKVLMMLFCRQFKMWRYFTYYMTYGAFGNIKRKKISGLIVRRKCYYNRYYIDYD